MAGIGRNLDKYFKKRRLVLRSDLPSPAKAGFAKAGALLRRVVRGDAGTRGRGDAVRLQLSLHNQDSFQSPLYEARTADAEIPGKIV